MIVLLQGCSDFPDGCFAAEMFDQLPGWGINIHGRILGRIEFQHELALRITQYLYIGLTLERLPVNFHEFLDLSLAFPGDEIQGGLIEIFAMLAHGTGLILAMMAGCAEDYKDDVAGFGQVIPGKGCVIHPVKSEFRWE